ncbi:MAG: hypothetical protein AMXMBFR59_42440 [Rhodanobacteraceae bacterium]
MPRPDIRNRADAIAFLMAQGFHAFARDWALGESIGVAAEPFEAAGIRGWRRIVYIAPAGETWEVHDLSGQADRRILAASLEAACQEVVRVLQAQPA